MEIHFGDLLRLKETTQKLNISCGKKHLFLSISAIMIYSIRTTVIVIVEWEFRDCVMMEFVAMRNMTPFIFYV